MSAAKLAAFPIAGVLTLGFLADGVTVVQPRQRAISVTLGHKGEVMHDGLHYVTPLLANINRFDLTLNVSENPNVLLKTKDSQTIHFDVIGHYCLTADCLDPEKAENVPDDEIDKQFYTFKDTSYSSVYRVPA